MCPHPLLSTLLFFLPFLSTGAVARTPIGCIMHSNTADYHTANCRMTEEIARDRCCNTMKQRFYAIGGRWEDSPMKTHHNAVLCFSEIPEESLVDPSLCNVGCPGDDYSFSIDQWGLCGGGCKGCDPTWPCDGDLNAKCGIYRSIYACDEAVTPAPAPPGGWGSSLAEDDTESEGGSGDGTSTVGEGPGGEATGTVGEGPGGEATGTVGEVPGGDATGTAGEGPGVDATGTKAPKTSTAHNAALGLRQASAATVVVSFIAFYM